MSFEEIPGIIYGVLKELLGISRVLQRVSGRFRGTPECTGGGFRGISWCTMSYQERLKGYQWVPGRSQRSQGRFKGVPRGLRGVLLGIFGYPKRYLDVSGKFQEISEVLWEVSEARREFQAMSSTVSFRRCLP